MITQRSLICVDFNDIKTVLNYGKIGLLGTGVATGPDAGRQATALAMDRILAQGCKLEKAKGALLIMQGSSFLKIENFEGMTYSALKYLSIEDKIVLGLTQNDELGYNVKVSVLIVM
jgi:cell division GTPase FtsZ